MCVPFFWLEKVTHDARRIVLRDDDVLRPELVQVERVPSELWVRAVEALAAAHELDEQRDGALDDRLRLGEQGFVLGSRGRTLSEERARRSTFALRTSKEVCACGREWAAVDRKRGAALDVEARVGEWAEEWEGRGGGYGYGYGRRRGGRVTG
jgi:hypothetical protein